MLDFIGTVLITTVMVVAINAVVSSLPVRAAGVLPPPRLSACGSGWRRPPQLRVYSRLAFPISASSSLSRFWPSPRSRQIRRFGAPRSLDCLPRF